MCICVIDSRIVVISSSQGQCRRPPTAGDHSATSTDYTCTYYLVDHALYTCVYDTNVHVLGNIYTVNRFM